MPTDHRAKLATIKRFDQLIAYLRDEMGWPIARDSFEDVDDGLPSGTYKVMLRPPDRINVLPEVARSAPANFGIQEKYMTSETSGFTLKLDRNISDYELVLDGLAAADSARLQKSPSQSLDRN